MLVGELPFSSIGDENGESKGSGMMEAPWNHFTTGLMDPLPDRGFNHASREKALCVSNSVSRG